MRLTCFDIADREEYLRTRAARRVKCGARGTVIALGGSANRCRGESEARQVFILVQWESRAALQSYLDDPSSRTFTPTAGKGGGRYLWHLFDRLEDHARAVETGLTVDIPGDDQNLIVTRVPAQDFNPNASTQWVIRLRNQRAIPRVSHFHLLYTTDPSSATTS